MRGLAEDEAEYLRERLLPLHSRPRVWERKSPDLFLRRQEIMSRLERRRLVILCLMWDENDDAWHQSEITPLGRIALACHIAEKSISVFR